LLALSFFKGRYWCWNLCPRGAFLDIVMPNFSRMKPLLKSLTTWKFITPMLLFVVLSAFLIVRMIDKGGSLLVIGAVFVSVCLVTTIISIVLGIATKPRSWCVICPMGKLQGKIGKMGKRRQQ